MKIVLYIKTVIVTTDNVRWWSTRGKRKLSRRGGVGGEKKRENEREPNEKSERAREREKERERERKKEKERERERERKKEREQEKWRKNNKRTTRSNVPTKAKSVTTFGGFILQTFCCCSPHRHNGKDFFSTFSAFQTAQSRSKHLHLSPLQSLPSSNW